MEPDDPLGDEGHHPRLLPPDDRLWRHPSELGEHGLPPGRRTRAGASPKLWVVALLSGLTGALFALGLVSATGNLRRILRVPVIERVAQRSDTLDADAGSASPEALAISRVVRPGIVGIEIEVEGVDRRLRGAGVMFRSDGHLVTNQHVVEGATRIVVVMADGHRADASVVGSDTWSDLAVVKVHDAGAVPVATMGSAEALTVGQKVMAVGGPVGQEEPAVAVGEINALGRQVERQGAATLLDMIQTSAPVAATASGGALVDGTGAVVGVLTALGPNGEVRSSRAGLATPIDWARAVAEQLLTTGRVARAWMGVEGTDLDGDGARRLGVEGGAVVLQVREGSPAGAAGLAADDVITSVDGAPLASMAALRVLLRAHRPGDVLALTVVRADATRSIDVRLTERPAQS
ncbi:MAG TPA: trypsin-like peptidase domain-containing protein [Acidimicrobiales bacterium]|nr:trypsin-like peptidase domain-containing protein [Acidimicrobiales bacterium]